METTIVRKEQYQKEQDKLLQTIIDLRYLNPWKGLTVLQENQSLRADATLELYITSKCDQHCEYCYLQKHPQLYPAEFNKPEIILHNLELVCQWILVNNFNIPCLDLFSGDIWGTQLGWDVFDILYKYLQQGMQIGYIMIASNCNFVMDPKALQIVQSYIDKFKALGCPIVYSISVDGKILDNESRPKNNQTSYTDEFYSIIGAFAVTNGFLFHPMISPHNVKNWIENYKWWKDFLKYYDFGMDALMTLEVRDKDWTDENIEDYCNLLRYMMDDFLHTKCHDDISVFTSALTGVKIKDENAVLTGYIPWHIGQVDTFLGCSASESLIIRLGDLAICPCHRTAYKEYLYGYLNVENDKITTIRASNPELAIHVMMGNLLTTKPLCDKCPFYTCCLRGCMGSQLETMRDPLFPISSVCKFFKAKHTAVLHYYREHKVIDELKNKYSYNMPGGKNAARILQVNDALEAMENGMGVS